MELTKLSAISPIDGRYREQVKELAPYFSEYGLMKYRVLIEVEYFINLCKIPLPQLQNFPKDQFQNLEKLYKEFSESDAEEIKETEKTTNHDVKAVEYFIKSRMKSWEQQSEFVHFGLTSQDINNTAIPLLLKHAVLEVYVPQLEKVIDKLNFLSDTWKDLPMLAKTHGQPASPTKLGKELFVFVERLNAQVIQLKNIPWSAKFGGATGNFNAHFVAYPEINWVAFSNNFVNNVLGLSRSQYTTQIEHYDNLASLFDCLKRINTVILDLDKDMWQYIAMNYFKQKIKAGEIGSSAMPHKVNPIDFENSEGNLGMANALFEHFSSKLPVSRLQRDLTDSTVLRNIGVPLAHTIIGLKSLLKGLDKIELNKQAIDQDLEENWAVVAEGIQTILRREGFPKPYEALKDLTRTGEKISAVTIKSFIQNLSVNEKVKEELYKLSPFTYTGIKF